MRIHSTGGPAAYVYVRSWLGVQSVETKYHVKMRAFARRCWTVGAVVVKVVHGTYYVKVLVAE